MKVFITTSGVGSRLGNLTEFTNKSMLKLGKKPVISYIIDQYPDDYEFVISLGYFGSHVRQFLELAYPSRNFIFVNVENYCGEGSSQIHSQLEAEKYLQEPFIYNDCDTIVNNLMSYIPETWNYDWLGGYPSELNKTRDLSLYDSMDCVAMVSKEGVTEYHVTNMYRKSECQNPDFLYIGISGIYDYKKFWKMLHQCEEEQDPKNLSDFAAYKIYNPFDKLRVIKFGNWTDTGSISGIMNARKNAPDKFSILDKNDQGIFIIGDNVIKFWARDGVVDNIMKHYENIESFANKIDEHTDNFIKYKYIDADIAIHDMNPKRFSRMILYFDMNDFWKQKEVSVSDDFKENQNDFYINKTLERVNKAKKLYKVVDNENMTINDVLIPKKYTIEYMLNILKNTEEYKNASYTRWHGDFVLDNMLYDGHKFILLDWREKFGKSVTYGDMHYDFAKMNHNLTFNFSSAYNHLYNVDISPDNNIHVSILSDNEVYKCKEVLKDYVEYEHKLSYDYIEAITGLIWVNMSPLHGEELAKLLFYMGKYTMFMSLSDYCKKHDILF